MRRSPVEPSSQRGFRYRKGAREVGEEEESYADKIKQAPNEDSRYHTSQRSRIFGMSSNFPRRGKPSKFFPESWEEVWMWKHLFNLICPRRNPSFNHTSIKIRGVARDTSPLTPTTASLRSQPEERCQRNTKQPTFLFLITNYFREALMALF